MDIDRLFIHNLKKWRKIRGISQKTLAQRCDAAHSYIRQIESGYGHPSFIFIGKLAKALNIEPFQLFFDEEAAKAGNLLLSDNIEALKTEFFSKMGREFDTIFKKIKT
jgi:transcriptional regulator with XRE-family HTH domain